MASTSHIPEGFHTVTPYLTIKDADKALEFMKHVFGAEETFCSRRADGTIGHASVRLGDAMIEMAEAGGEWTPMPCALHVYVEDTDAVYQRALEAGGTSLFAPEDMYYGERGAGVRDMSGNNWYIATHKEDLTMEELREREAARTQGAES